MASGLQGLVYRETLTVKLFNKLTDLHVPFREIKGFVLKLFCTMDHILTMFYKGLNLNQWFFKLLCLEGHDDPWVWIWRSKSVLGSQPFQVTFLSAKSIIKATVLKIALMLASFYFEFLINGFRKHLPVFFITCCQSVIITCLMSFQCWSLKAFWTIKSERIASFTNSAKQLRCVVKSQLRIFA